MASVHKCGEPSGFYLAMETLNNAIQADEAYQVC